MKITIIKHEHLLTVSEDGAECFRCNVSLGRCPGKKTEEGDGKTPEGVYHICLIREQGKYGRNLGLDYPSPADILSAYAEGRADVSARDAVLAAHAEGGRPPWGTPLGGEIYLHEQKPGAAGDWTQGCVALSRKDMDILWPLRERIVEVVILP